MHGASYVACKENYKRKANCMRERERDWPARGAEKKWVLGLSHEQEGWRCASLWVYEGPWPQAMQPQMPAETSTRMASLYDYDLYGYAHHHYCCYSPCDKIHPLPWKRSEQNKRDIKQERKRKKEMGLSLYFLQREFYIYIRLE